MIISMVFAFNLNLKAQLPDGSIGPDFTATDIDGVEHHLYDYLDDGKMVIIDFFTTGCGPCWTYHNQHILDEMWELYGPDGTNEVMIFQIEVNNYSGMNELLGGNGSQGNWIEGIMFPTIDDLPNPNNPDKTIIGSLYEVIYWPTIYVICPSRITNEDQYEDNYMTVEELYAFMGNCQMATEQVDAAISNYTGPTEYCDGQLNDVEVILLNLGLEGNLTQAVVNTILNGNIINTTDYTGDIALYSRDTVQIGSLFNLPDGANLTFQVIVEGDTYLDNNELNIEVFEVSTESNLNFTIEVQPDNFPAEIGFDLYDDSGNLLFELVTGTINTEDLQTFDITLDEPACISWNIHDGAGDGICCAFGEGQIRLLDTESGEELLVIDGDYGWGITKRFAALNPNVGINKINKEKIQIFPNPACDNITIVAGSIIKKIEFYDKMGRLVNVYQCSQRYKDINITNMFPGIYTVKIISNAGISVSKLIIE